MLNVKQGKDDFQIILTETINDVSVEVAYEVGEHLNAKTLQILAQNCNAAKAAYKKGEIVFLQEEYTLEYWAENGVPSSITSYMKEKMEEAAVLIMPVLPLTHAHIKFRKLPPSWEGEISFLVTIGNILASRSFRRSVEAQFSEPYDSLFENRKAE